VFNIFQFRCKFSFFFFKSFNHLLWTTNMFHSMRVVTHNLSLLVFQIFDALSLSFAVGQCFLQSSKKLSLASLKFSIFFFNNGNFSCKSFKFSIIFLLLCFQCCNSSLILLVSMNVRLLIVLSSCNISFLLISDFSLLISQFL
jgi:hypothetical protein